MTSLVWQSSTRQKLEFLSCAASYPGQCQPVEVIETHFAWVFLTSRHAYKMKKPLRQDVMDYRSVASRARGCRNELRLNRRLAPAVYLEVVPLGCRADGSLVLGRGKHTVDWLVKMRRLPAGRMLDRLIAHRSVCARDRNALIDLLAAFYAGAAAPRPMPPTDYVLQLSARRDENLRALCASGLRMDRPAVLRTVQQQCRYVDSNIDLLHARAGRLVDAHGDLRPEHLFPGSQLDEACVIDCLEFDPRLRRLDPLEELAFLGLECRRLGAQQLAQQLMHGVQAAMGEVVPASLTAFYMSQRALTRAKLAAWHLRGSHQTRRSHWIRRAHSYLRDALYFANLALQERQSRTLTDRAARALTRSAALRIRPSSLNTSAT